MTAINFEAKDQLNLFFFIITICKKTLNYKRVFPSFSEKTSFKAENISLKFTIQKFSR